MKELIKKITERKAELESRLEARSDYEGTMDYAEHVEGDAARSEAYRDEITFLASLLETPAEREITDELLEEHGFVADEPGIWFLEMEDEKGDTSFVDGLHLRQNLRRQDKWELLYDKDGSGYKITQLRCFNHLLALLDEIGYTFKDEDDDDEE